MCGRVRACVRACVCVCARARLFYCTISQLQTTCRRNLWSNIPLNILTSDILVPVYDTYENLVVSSVGLKRFNLLGPSSSSSRAGVSSLGCVISFLSRTWKSRKVPYICRY